MGRDAGDLGRAAEVAKALFYDRLQALLADAGLDASGACKRYYAAVVRAPSLPPGRYLRMRLGYLEGIGTERGLKWRCADSLSPRDFLGLGLRHRMPDRSWLSRSPPQC